MVRVMIVDDEAPIRWGLQLILGSAGDIEVVAACDGVRAVEEAQRHRPDVVLLDLRMPQVDGLAVLRQIMRWPRPPAVAVLTTSDSDELVAQALESGAAGFLVKDTEPEHLVHAVRTLAAGGDVPSPAVTHTVGGGYVDGGARAADRARIEAMSPRERDVLGLIGQGLSNVEIGRRLQLSTAAVTDYVRAVLDRLNVTDRVQAAVVAREAGMPPPSEGESR